jgi:hypothetical protein
MLLPVFVTLAAVTLSTPSPSAGAGAARAGPTAPRRAGKAPSSAQAPRVPLDPNELYSSRARRRIASYLRLRLLELREENLERAAEVIRRRLPVDTLLTP